MPLGDPQECRKRALYCAKRAVECGSPLAQEKFFNLAKTWMRLAIELEQQCALLDQWGDRPTEKEPKGALKDASASSLSAPQGPFPLAPRGGFHPA